MLHPSSSEPQKAMSCPVVPCVEGWWRTLVLTPHAGDRGRPTSHTVYLAMLIRMSLSFEDCTTCRTPRSCGIPYRSLRYLQIEHLLVWRL